MPLDPYSTCPCGSGKKFKWCCQPIQAEIDRAFQQEAEGQHDVALRLMDEVIKNHPANPVPWGRRAQLLYQNGRVEDAEEALRKAFEINPKYAFGHLLRGIFRYQEGEIPGALMLFRKAAEQYDPEAHDQLAQLYGFIADCELRMNRPIAARAALRLVLRFDPAEVETREQFDALFGEQGRLPAAARADYKFRSPAPSLGGERRAAWDLALAGLEQARLADAGRIFEDLTKSDTNDAAAAFNLGLAKAWLGDNSGALDALDRYVALETDEAKAGEAWALGEVLRCGAGMEDQSDYHEHSVLYQLRDARPIEAVLNEWVNSRRLLPLQTEDKSVFSALVLDAAPVLVATPGLLEAAPLGAYLVIAGGVVRAWGPSSERLEKVRGEIEQRAGAGLRAPQTRVTRPNFSDIITEAVLFPVGVQDQAEAARRVEAFAQQFFEESWINRQLKSLNGTAPVDAAGHAVLRKKLRGVVQFLQDCSRGGALAGYDFDRLRRKLGLLTGGAAPTPTATGPDITAMGAAELAALQAESLSDSQLEQAWLTAKRLDAQEISTHFAKALTARPLSADKTDRYPVFSYLIDRALNEGQSDAALDLVNEGEKADCEQNEGRRRNDYELRRAKLHAKRGEADAAHDVFERLIQRDPSNLAARAAATEAMLSMRQGPRALSFAEKGLVEARKQQNRDAEGHLLELSAAARKLG
jgi:tetratricopeptide (TPR) repeat protein